MNPFLGVFFHWLGGLASGSFYVPYRAVRRWSWETYWLTGGFFSWIIAPWILAFLMTQDVLPVLHASPSDTLFWCYFFGTMWGLGGLTFGLTMRYLGMSLGMAVALGYCAAFGTLIPPIFKHEFVSKVLCTTSGQIILFGIAVCLAGIAVAGWAGMMKEREMSEEKKKAVIKEFNFKKGILVATFSGIMSSAISFGIDAGDPIKELSIQHGTQKLFAGLPVLIIVLFGGFTTNFIWCAILNIKNKTWHQYFCSTNPNHKPTRSEETIIETAIDAPAEEVFESADLVVPEDTGRVPMLRNYFFCAVAGTTWYMQFFFYTMGESQMGTFKFSSWSLHMASIIIFSTLWGICLHEWKGSSRRAIKLVTLGLFMLILSTVIIGYGNYLKPPENEKDSKAKPAVSQNDNVSHLNTPLRPKAK
jgi:L-rhamnose-H+ transport protein